MSNTLAVATVSATLKQHLESAITAEFPSATVKFGQPQAPIADPVPEVIVSLYQVTTNPAVQNMSLPTRSSSGKLYLQPQAALDLHYLISFYGDEEILEPQRLLGRVVQTLSVKPVFTKAMITAAIEGNAFLALEGPEDPERSNLDQEPVEQVKFHFVNLSTDDLIKIWSSLYHTIPYSLSIMYHASVVIIDGGETVTQNASPTELRLATRGFIPPRHKATAIAFEDTNSTAEVLSGTLTITKADDESDLTHYLIYWGSNATTKLATEAPLAFLPKTGNDLTYPLTDVTIPAGATHFLVFSANPRMEMTYGINLPIVDNTGS